MIGPSHAWNAVLQLVDHGSAQCIGYSGLPLLDPVQITIVADRPSVAAPSAALFGAMRQALRNLVVPAATESSCGGPTSLGCMARGESACRGVLVMVADSVPVDATTTSLLQRWRRHGRHFQDQILPVLPAGASPSTVLPAPFDKLQVLRTPAAMSDLVPDVLRVAGIGGNAHKLFISYRRADSRALADVIHDDFTHAGFQVFLDRFSGTPGRSFPFELAEELMDKGVVVVIESVNLARSRWTIAEVAFAAHFRLGLVAVNVNNAPQFASIPARDRLAVNMPSGSVVTTTRSAIVSFVREAYARQTFRRRTYLSALLAGALAKHGQIPRPSPSGVFDVAGTGRSYAVHLTSAPPGLADVRRVRASGSGTYRVVVGAHAYLPPEPRSDMSWLADALQINLVDEGILVLAVDEMVAGTFPP